MEEILRKLWGYLKKFLVNFRGFTVFEQILMTLQANLKEILEKV